MGMAVLLCVGGRIPTQIELYDEGSGKRLHGAITGTATLLLAPCGSGFY